MSNVPCPPMSSASARHDQRSSSQADQSSTSLITVMSRTDHQCPSSTADQRKQANGKLCNILNDLVDLNTCRSKSLLFTRTSIIMGG